MHWVFVGRNCSCAACCEPLEIVESRKSHIKRAQREVNELHDLIDALLARHPTPNWWYGW